MFVGTAYVMWSALLTTAVEANAILPAAVVLNAPVGISTIVPPPSEIGDGGVIVAIAAVPDTKTIFVTGAMVVALAASGLLSRILRW